MQKPPIGNQKSNVAGPLSAIQQSSKSPDVIVNIGTELPASSLITHARLVAESMGGNVILVQCIEPPMNNRTPYDPVDWDLRKREAKATLTHFAETIGKNSDGIKTALLEGHIVDQISARISQRPQDITTIFRKPAQDGWDVGDPARSIMESDIGSVLMIPMESADNVPETYSRIIVPLDGSSRAETAVPKAVRLAKTDNAELILCHVTPAPGVSQIRQSDVEAKAISSSIARYNQRIGQQYLSRLESRVRDCGVHVSTCVSGNGDVRRALLKLVEDQHANLLVLASHGQSNYPDVSTGDIANFVMSRSTIPVLMVRQPGKAARKHIYSDVKSKGVRPATVTMQ